MDQCGHPGSAPPIDLSPPAEKSVGPLVGADKARFALAGIGQGDVFTTPLQMALIAEGIANGGVIKEPHVVSEVRNSSGKTVQTAESKDWMTCMQPTTAAALANMMVEVVQPGHRNARTAPMAGIRAWRSPSKTGTAQTGDPGERPHACVYIALRARRKRARLPRSRSARRARWGHRRLAAMAVTGEDAGRGSDREADVPELVGREPMTSLS